jgi:chemotaxis-related protein WspD
MTRPETNQPPSDSLPAEACWSQIGIQGDRTCPRLAEAGHCRNCPVFAEGGQRLFEREAPADYVAQWTRQLAQPDAAAVADTISLLVFRIGAEWLALEARSVIEVISPRPIHRVPHRSNRLLLGVANIRGELQICTSLQDLLGIEPPAAGDTSAARSRPRMIVAEHEGSRWVFPVDEVDGIHRIAAAAMEELPYTVGRSARYYCQALFHYDRKKVGALSAGKLFQAMEGTVQ